MKNISILGSTGSIGTQTLEIVRANPDLNVVALSANNNIKLLAKQVLEFSPELVCVFDTKNLDAFKEELIALKVKKFPEIYTGKEGLVKVATAPKAKVVVTAIVGMVGIIPTMEAIKAKKDIALANKETLVCAGELIINEAKKRKVNIYPVDSEHSAIFQSMNGERKEEVEKIILTASGGPFRGKKKEELENVTLEDALNHPNWSMGKKVTIDSSTLANKGLEVIEARWLFDVEPENIEVVIQPQSIIHSAVQYKDGAIIAQIGTPDMHLPIQYALFYPQRRFLEGKRVDLFELGEITFEKPDTNTFKALALAYKAIKIGGSMPTVFNAANERAVAKFLKGEIKYLDIADEIEKAMDNHTLIQNPTLEQIVTLGDNIINERCS